MYLNLSLSLSLFLSLSLSFVGQVMSHHHSDYMSQRSQVPRVALCCQKVKGVNEVVTGLGIELSQTFV